MRRLAGYALIVATWCASRTTAFAQSGAVECDCDAEVCVAYGDELRVEGTVSRRRYTLHHPTIGRMPQEVYVLRVARPVCGFRNVDGGRVDDRPHVREMVISARTDDDPLRRLVGRRGRWQVRVSTRDGVSADRAPRGVH